MLLISVADESLSGRDVPDLGSIDNVIGQLVHLSLRRTCRYGDQAQASVVRDNFEVISMKDS